MKLLVLLLLASPLIVGMSWNRFYSYHEIDGWLGDLNQQYGVPLGMIGQSYENRSLRVVKIGIAGGRKRKKSIWIDGGVHANEWGCPAVATYIINELIVNGAHYIELLQKVDFYVMPLLNPDGYEYSLKRERHWVKSRGQTSRERCRGVDLNRNFDIGFHNPGSSRNPCNASYGGPMAFSEPETRALRDFFISEKKIDADWTLYITLHSYGQHILTPYAFTVHTYPDHQALVDLARKAARQMYWKHGRKYTVGSLAHVQGIRGGASVDWAKMSGFFKYAYDIVIRDRGKYGYRMPEREILPAAEEIWAGVLAMAEEIAQMAEDVTPPGQSQPQDGGSPQSQNPEMGGGGNPGHGMPSQGSPGQRLNQPGDNNRPPGQGQSMPQAGAPGQDKSPAGGSGAPGPVQGQPPGGSSSGMPQG